MEEADGVHFITMELVRGKTLTELLPKNGFSFAKFFDIATIFADAVAAAHEERSTHRDLKPDNVMVGDDGRVRVLDFGLAKPARGFTREAGGSEVATEAKTRDGAIVETVHYMSPEQAAGKGRRHRCSVLAAISNKNPSEWAEITHPFHPLHGQRFPISKTMCVLESLNQEATKGDLESADKRLRLD